ncbi:hypothetical protein Tco_0127936 [Tanacetum coccineum]
MALLKRRNRTLWKQLEPDDILEKLHMFLWEEACSHSLFSLTLFLCYVGLLRGMLFWQNSLAEQIVARSTILQELIEQIVPALSAGIPEPIEFLSPVYGLRIMLLSTLEGNSIPAQPVPEGKSSG